MERHEIQYQLGLDAVKDSNGTMSFKPIYHNLDINVVEYSQIKEAINLFRFLEKTERAYEFILNNYHDYEENNFSTILKNELISETSLYQHHRNYNSFLNKLLNLLNSTYLYTCILRVNRKNKEKKNDNGEYDFSFYNSSDLKNIYNIKLSFKEETNKYHKNIYQYTFMSALRNKLNHGKSLPEGFYTGSYWSLYWDSEKSKELGFLVKNKDQRFSELDHEIKKDKAKEIIAKKEYFNSIERICQRNFT